MIDSISDSQSESAVTAATLIDEAAMNMLRQIAQESAEPLTENKMSIYTRALKLLKEVTASATETGGDKTTVELGEAEEYAI